MATYLILKQLTAKYRIHRLQVYYDDTFMQTAALIDTFKREPKQRCKTYRHVAKTLGMSEARIRRLFSERSLKLDRLDQTCNMLNI